MKAFKRLSASSDSSLRPHPLLRVSAVKVLTLIRITDWRRTFNARRPYKSPQVNLSKRPRVVHFAASAGGKENS
jgi:hypothetical protein